MRKEKQKKIKHIQKEIEIMKVAGEMYTNQINTNQFSNL